MRRTVTLHLLLLALVPIQAHSQSVPDVSGQVIVLIAVFIFAGPLYASDELAFHAVGWVFRRFGLNVSDVP